LHFKLDALHFYNSNIILAAVNTQTAGR